MLHAACDRGRIVHAPRRPEQLLMGGDEALDPQTESLIAKVAGNPVAMLMLARTLLLPRGKTKRARALCEAAVKLAPGDAEVQALAQSVRSRDVGQWYFTMVQDRPRHALYAAAFRKVFTPGCAVLDIGAGTGLFAMLAAREGAGQVIACERESAVAEAARESIERNGYGDRVKLVAKDSRELEIGVDLDDRADVLLWDNLSNNLLGAGALDAIDDARRRLLKPGAPMIPARCEMRVALVEANPVCDVRMGTVEGFDMTPFNRFRPTQTTLGKTKLERRSDAATIFDFDFASGRLPGSRDSVTVAATGGCVDGIAQWIRFHLADDVVYDTGDDEGVTAFGIEYHAVEPFEADAGQGIAIRGAHDRKRTWFWIASES
jgi:SAM-dependent methyltransferase